MKDPVFKGAWNRVLQLLARIGPGATTWRVKLHRWRGVKIGKNVWIGYDTIIETSYPHLVTILDGAAIGIIGQGAVVTAGSVVTQSVPPMTVVQGNPAKAIATVGLPLKMNVSVRQFSKRLKPLVRAR